MIRKLLVNVSKQSSMNVFKRINRLRKFPIFQSLSESKKLTISNILVKEVFQSGDIIYSEKESAYKFYLLLDGRVKIIKNTQFVREYDEGCTFGEIALINDECRTETAVAVSDVILYTLSKDSFMDLIDETILGYLRNKICNEDQSVEISKLYTLSFLGKGKFGSVYLGHNRISLYAIKCIPRLVLDKQKSLIRFIQSEKNILLTINHPFCLKLVKTLKNDTHVCFLMEFINGVLLEDYMTKNKGKKNLYEVKFYAACLFIVVNYLHSKNIIHRDIKPSNIIIDKNGYIKLIDFGAAKIIKDCTMTVIGTPHFVAPEVISGKGYSFSCDYWSISVIMYSLYYGSLPFGEKSDVMEIYKDILTKYV
jgi:cGMP-dependent protein kinase